MPRKPKPTNRRISVMVNDAPIEVTLYSPRGRKRTWYALWNGVPAAQSTGQVDFDEAVTAVQAMLRNGGKRVSVAEASLSDEEFIEIQRTHYAKKQAPESRRRSQKSLLACLDAIVVFREITKLSPITIATPDDCERFQREALAKPRNWRVKYADTQRSHRARKSPGELGTISPDTVDKWSRALQAAFERANINAGKKCVRGVVPPATLLRANPWTQFTWIEKVGRALRHFSDEELISLLDYFEQTWNGVAVAATFIKFCLWSSCRREEISKLRWDDLREISDIEMHFYVLGKWQVERWVRIPPTLLQEMKSYQTDSPFVFDAYGQQLREHYLKMKKGSAATKVRLDFRPDNFGQWMYQKLKTWQVVTGRENAYLHIFRKTGLQLARQGEDLNREVAADAAVSESVMMSSYVWEAEEQLRQRSNRMYRRLLQRLSSEVARRYGYQDSPKERLVSQLNVAAKSGEWATVERLAAELKQVDHRENGNGKVSP